MLDPELRAKPARMCDSQGPVRCDAFVNRDADQLGVAAVLEKPREEGGRGARVLSAAHPDCDPFSTPQVDLGSEFALCAPLHEIEKMLPAEMVSAVSNPFDRGSAAPIAGHVRAKRCGTLRPHGPPGGGNCACVGGAGANPGVGP